MRKESTAIMIPGSIPDIGVFEKKFERMRMFCGVRRQSDQDDVKEPFKYLISAFIFDTTFGSKHTNEFIDSLIGTKNDEILRTEMVRKYTRFMWKRARLYMLAQGLL
jgi:hypothetical protein